MNIPVITDSNIEVFASDFPKCLATFGGKKVGFWELPTKEIERIAKVALSDKSAMKTFKEEGITDQNQIVETWAWCNLGRFDVIPDIETKTGKLNLEFHNCGRRDKCPYEYRRCKRVNANGELLTPRETIYLRYSAMGLPDKQIAERMNLKPKSMISLAQRVRGKIGVVNRAGLASWAIRVML